jgi:hypothetical protein
VHKKGAGRGRVRGDLAAHDHVALDTRHGNSGRLEADALGGVLREDDLAQVGVLDRLDLRRLVAFSLGWS